MGDGRALELDRVDRFPFLLCKAWLAAAFRRGTATELLSGSCLSSLGSMTSGNMCLSQRAAWTSEVQVRLSWHTPGYYFLHCMRCVDAGAPVLLRPRCGGWATVFGS